MIWATASLLVAVTAPTGKSAEISATASHAVVIDAAATVSERVLWSFGASGDGQFPLAGAFRSPTSRANLYGTTSYGGVNCPFILALYSLRACGTVFELSPPAGQQTQWRERVLWSFVASGDGAFPVAGLLADKWGNLFGTTVEGGVNCPSYGCGTVFELNPPPDQQTQWRERVLWSFGATSDDGQFPEAGLIADKRGNLYGTTRSAGANCPSYYPYGCGTVFELSPPPDQETQWHERVLWSFGATSDDGQLPVAGLIADERGNLYGTTTNGGANFCLRDTSSCGTVFELNPPPDEQTQWRERVLWSFGATSDDGQLPVAGLIADKRGNLYGTTVGGGITGFAGTVFELNPPPDQQTQWHERVLWSFGSTSDEGVFPEAGLIADKRGNLYGTTR